MSNDLTALLERAAGEAPATRATLTDGAVRRGTTLRRRRRAAQGLASLSVAAGVLPRLTAFRADGLVTWFSSYNAAAEKGGANRAARR